MDFLIALCSLTPSVTNQGTNDYYRCDLDKRTI